VIVVSVGRNSTEFASGDRGADLLFHAFSNSAMATGGTGRE
jgi:hypothetical protein